MGWIESHQSLKEHPKTYRLARLLRRSRPEVIGHLHCLWWWALDALPGGDLAQVDDLTLREVCLFSRQGAVLRSALIESGFVDANGHIHQWEHYIERLLLKRLANQERKERWRERRSGTRGGTRPPRVRNDATDRPTDRPTNQPTNTHSCASRKERECAEQIYQAYPRKTAKGAAIPAIIRAMKRIEHDGLSDGADSYSWLLERTHAFATSSAGQAGTFTPHPATWFNQARYLDDPIEWERKGDGSNQGRSSSSRGHVAPVSRFGPGRRYIKGGSSSIESSPGGDPGHDQSD